MLSKNHLIKKLLQITFHLVFVWSIGFGQEPPIIDSLKNELLYTRVNEKKIDILIELCNNYWSVNADSSLSYGQQALSLAQQTGDSKRESIVSQRIGGVYQSLGDYPRSFEFLFRGLEIANKKQYPDETINCLAQIGNGYVELKDYPKAISYLQQALKKSTSIHDANTTTLLAALIGTAYENYDQTDSAFLYMQKAFKGNDTLRHPFLELSLFTRMGSYSV